MRIDRLGTGEGLAGAGGVLLAVALFLPWFGDLDAWQAFDVVDVLLLLAALAGIGVAILAAANAKTDVPVASAALAVPIGLLATALVLYRVLDPVGDASRKIGLFLGLAGAAAIAYGCMLAIRDDRTGRPNR
jgi:hypothetical protein